MTSREGTIKFECFWKKTGPVVDDHLLKQINSWRDILYGLNLIGAYSDGVGFGNISVRTGEKSGFIITGTGTGKFRHLTRHHFSLVTGYSFPRNTLACQGPVRASAESMSHAAIYEASQGIQAVMHVHHPGYWKILLSLIPATDKQAEFGTPEMAFEIKRLFRETDVADKRILVMGGHKDGIITFGKDLDEAGGYLLAYINSMM